MQETTSNTPFFATIHSWLDALYAEASQKILLQNLDIDTLTQVISIQKLESKIHYTFKEKTFLINALTQSTFCYEFKEIMPLKGRSLLVSNERLEFLGDSLVNLIVGKLLYKKFPHLSEGDLSKFRGSLVNEHSLSKLAKAICLGENLFLGKGEHRMEGQKKDSILADAFEALCAAIYLDGHESIPFVEHSIECAITEYEKISDQKFFAMENLENFDSKTKLQEISMSMFQILPLYKSIEVKEGSLLEFKVELWVGERKLAEGIGPSKKKLEKQLARIVLDEKRYL